MRSESEMFQNKCFSTGCSDGSHFTQRLKVSRENFYFSLIFLASVLTEGGVFFYLHGFYTDSVFFSHGQTDGQRVGADARTFQTEL